MKLRIVSVPGEKFAVQIKRRFWFGWDFLGTTRLLVEYLADETCRHGAYGLKIYPPFAFIPTQHENVQEARASAERFRQRRERERKGTIEVVT